jgi:hypothetical protein
LRLTPHGSAGMAGVAIDTCLSFLVTVEAPFHVHPVYHLHRSVFCSCKAVADGAIHSILNMDPVRKDHMAGQLIHPFPWNRLLCLDVFHHFERLGPLAHGIGRVTGPADLDVRDSCDPLPLNIAVAEGTVQFSDLRMVDMVEQDRLIDGYPGKDREEGEEDVLGLNLKPVESHDTQQEDQDDSDPQNDPLFHNLYAM